MTTPTLLALIATAVVALIALVWDLRTRRIPNALTVSAFVAALVFHTVVGGMAGLGTSLAGFATGFGLLFVLWIIGGGGGGDVKLMGALGAWLGATLTLVVFLGSAFVALVMMLAVMMWQSIGRAAGQPAYAGAGGNGNHSKGQMTAARRVIPYAVPVAITTWVVVALKMMIAWT